MTTSFIYDQQIEELPEFWTDETVDEFLETQEPGFDDYYSQYEDDQELEYYSLCCAYGEEF